MNKFTFLLLFLPIFAFSQPYERKNIDFEHIDLLPPMKIPMILAGNFGEMRSNHFHTGLDIKTAGVEGQNLYAVDEGVISRIRISPWGYGLAIYIQHPNGLTSLYGHMKSFSPKLDSLAYECQKKNESFILDEDVLSFGVKVKRGEFIGLSGNSGSSSAAHLHFEIRETKTEHALNPLLFNCYRKKIADNTPPTLKGIKVYAVNEKGYLIPGKAKYFYVKYVNGQYIVNDGQAIDVSDLATENSYLAFGFHVTDKLDGAGNVCGIHHSLLTKEDEVLHEQQTDYINFDNNRFLNSHQDYFEFTQNKRNIHKNFKTVINPLGIYPKPGGLIDWENCKANYQFQAFDVHGNLSLFNFAITYAQPSELAKNPFNRVEDYYFPDSVNTLLRSHFQVLMEPGTFYEPIQRIFKIDSSKNYLSPGYIFSESEIPLQKTFDVRIKSPELAVGTPLNKLAIGVISDKGRLSYKGGDYIDGWVEAASRDFGKFVLIIDSVPPKITPLDYSNGKSITKFRNLQLTIEDNLSGVWIYKAFINESWVLMEYDRKKQRYIIPLDERSKVNLRQGDNKLRIYTRDGKSNETEMVWNIVY